MMPRFRYDPLAMPAINRDPDGEFCRWSDVAPILRAARIALQPDHAWHEMAEARRKLDEALAREPQP